MRGSHSRNDVESGERAGCGDGGAAQSRQVVAVGMRDLLDQTEHAQPSELARHGRRRHVQPSHEIGSAPAVDVELAVLQGSQQRLVAGAEEVQALDRRVGAHARLAQPLQIALAGAGVVQAGQERQVALVAAQQDLAQVDQAVDRLLQRRQLARGRRALVFHLAVVLEKAHVVDGGLHAQHARELVVDLHAGRAHVVLDAAALDARGQPRADLLRQRRA